MKNQDPLNPMQNAELTSQLAQISTVEGITNLKNTLLSIGGQIDVSQSMSAVAMIGKGVLVPGSKVKVGVDAQNPEGRVVTPYGIDLQKDAAKVQVRISDANGAVIRTMELGEKKVGVYTLDWDGKNDAGVAMEAGAYGVGHRLGRRGQEGRRRNAELRQGQERGLLDQRPATGPGPGRPDQHAGCAQGDRRLSAVIVPLYM